MANEKERRKGAMSFYATDATSSLPSLLHNTSRVAFSLSLSLSPLPITEHGSTHERMATVLLQHRDSIKLRVRVGQTFNRLFHRMLSSFSHHFCVLPAASFGQSLHFVPIVVQFFPVFIFLRLFTHKFCAASIEKAHIIIHVELQNVLR